MVITQTDIRIVNAVYYGTLSKYNHDIFHPVVVFVYKVQLLIDIMINESFDINSATRLLDDLCSYTTQQHLTDTNYADIISCWDLCSTIIMPVLWHKLRVST